MIDINKYKKLEESIHSQDFNKSYGGVSKVLYILSIFGNIASIFLAYFLVSKSLSGIVKNQIVVSISSVILLGCLEFFKREIFDKFSVQYLKNKELLHRDVLPLLITSFIIVSLSFYASVNGAIEFSNKTVQIDDTTVKTIKNYSDSLTVIYNSKINVIDSEESDSKNKINLKDKEETDIQSNQYLTPTQRGRVRDLKNEKSELKNDIVNYERQKDQIKNELKDKINEFTKSVNSSASQDKTENNRNSYIFVVLSMLIELTILVGVYFNEYFKFRSYSEYKKKLEQDPNYQKWYMCDSILDALYNEDTKINDKLSSTKSIVELCKAKGVNVTQKDIEEFIKILISISILKSSGRNIKLFNKSKDAAKDTLKKQFNII